MILTNPFSCGIGCVLDPENADRAMPDRKSCHCVDGLDRSVVDGIRYLGSQWVTAQRERSQAEEALGRSTDRAQRAMLLLERGV